MVLLHYFYCYRGVTVNFLPSPRYYCEIFPIYRGITAFPITVSLSILEPPPHQLWSLGECCKLPSGAWGGARPLEGFLKIYSLHAVSCCQFQLKTGSDAAAAMKHKTFQHGFQNIPA